MSITKLKLIIILLLLSCYSCFALSNSLGQEYDIANIPSKYQKDFEIALNSWHKLKDKERAFYKVLGHEINGDNRPFLLRMMDDTLVHFTYPWSLNKELPFAIGYNTPYFSQYHPRKKMDDVPAIEGSLDAVFIDGLDFEAFKSGDKPIRLHLKKEVGETSLFLSAEANADWDITWEKGVSIRQIIVPKTIPNIRIKTQSTVNNIIKSKHRIEGYTEEAIKIRYNKNFKVDWDLYQSANIRIKEALEVTPRSITFGKNVNYIELDGSAAKPPVPEGKRLGGLWYFEASVIGESSRYTIDIGNRKVSLLDKLSSVVKRGDVIQFAIDLDNANVYVGLNGEWIVGDPDYLGSGIRIKPNSTNPIGGEGFNFGGKPFQYKMPDKYQPYDFQFSEMRLADNLKVARYKLTERDFSLPQFPSKIYKRTTPEFRLAWASFQNAIKDYREKACSLTYAYRTQSKVSYVNLEPQCVWFIKGHLSKAMDWPTKSLKGSQGRARQHLPKINTKGAKLHLLKSHGAGTKKLLITDKSAPLIVFIEAYYPQEWEVVLGKGVTVRNIVMYGQYPQTYKLGKNTNTEVSLYSSEESTAGILWPAIHKGRKSEEEMNSQLQGLFGIAPTTMQRCEKKSQCTIDGITNNYFKK